MHPSGRPHITHDEARCKARSTREASSCHVFALLSGTSWSYTAYYHGFKFHYAGDQTNKTNLSADSQILRALCAYVAAI